MQPVSLSVVIPTVNSERKIVGTINEVLEKLSLYRKLGLIGEFEVLPVAQVSDDRTFALLHKYDVHAAVHPHYLSKRGKGLACTYGALKAKHSWILFFDDDLNYPANFLLDAVPLTERYDVIIASRVGRKNMPLTRRTASFAFRKLACWLFDLHGIYDLQAGEKLVRHNIFCFEPLDCIHELVCNKVHMAEHGFVWDTELLYKAKRLGKKIAEVPIVYTYEENFLQVSSAWWQMGMDLLRLRWREWKK